MINFKKLREQALRQQQRHDEGLSEGDSVMSSRTGVKGTIHRVGGNYSIVLSVVVVISVISVSYTHMKLPTILLV